MEFEDLKIVHVNDVAFVGSNLVMGLCKNGVNAKLYKLSRFSEKKLPKILQLGISIFFRIIEIFRLKKYLKQEKINIIHVHYGTHAYLPFFLRVPFYLHIHGTDVRTHVNWPLVGIFVRWGIRNAERVFYSTPDLKPMVEKFRRDAIFFPNPVDTQKFFPKEGLGKNNDLTIFLINKLDRFKGNKKVITALELIWLDFLSLKVKMFGFGNTVEEFQYFIEKHSGEERLSILPHISNSEMVENIQTSDIIIGQLETGSLGVSELEAMSCGKPVICKFNFADMYPEPPPVLVANTPEEVRDKLIFLINHPDEGEKIGQKAREWVVEYYDYRKVAQKLLNIYLEKK